MMNDQTFYHCTGILQNDIEDKKYTTSQFLEFCSDYGNLPKITKKDKIMLKNYFNECYEAYQVEHKRRFKEQCDKYTLNEGKLSKDKKAWLWMMSGQGI